MKTDVDKNRCFRNLLYRVPFGKLGLLLAFLIVASHLWGQGITVKGRVTDTDDAPVIGASVLVEGTESGMITYLDGNYVTNNVPSDAVLVFSYVGMVTQKVAVSGRHVVNVKLEDDNVLLDETVVIGGRVSESIFEIQNEASTYGWENYYDYTNNEYTVPSQSMWRWKFYSAGPLGWSDYNSEVWLLYAFKNEKAKYPTNDSEWDERIPASLFYADIFTDFPEHVQWQTWTATEGTSTSGGTVTTDEPGFSYADWVEDRVYINKYTAQYEDYQEVNSDNSEGTNNRIFRLGEIMLDYAECLAQTGDITEAVNVLNEVRNRAGLCNLGERQDYKVESVYTNPDTDNSTVDFNDDYGYAAFENGQIGTLEDFMAVLDIEDMKETAFECERVIDLRRWGISRDDSFLQRVKKRSYKYYTNFNSVRAWIPMPTDDVNNNPNLEQLPGW